MQRPTQAAPMRQVLQKEQTQYRHKHRHSKSFHGAGEPARLGVLDVLSEALPRKADQQMLERDCSRKPSVTSTVRPASHLSKPLHTCLRQQCQQRCSAFSVVIGKEALKVGLHGKTPLDPPAQLVVGE